MKAKFTSLCVSCGSEIKPGKEIAKNNEGNWIHKYCAEEAELP